MRLLLYIILILYYPIIFLSNKTMNIFIRKATIEDLQNVQLLNLQLFSKEQKEYDSSLDLQRTFSKVGTKYYQDRILKNNGCVLIAITNDNIVGYLCGSIKKAEDYRKLSNIAELENTFVLEKYRSKGIGQKLYDEFIKWCKEKKASKVRVETFAKNDLTIKFYKNQSLQEYQLTLESYL